MPGQILGTGVHICLCAPEEERNMGLLPSLLEQNPFRDNDPYNLWGRMLDLSIGEVHRSVFFSRIQQIRLAM